MDNLRYFGKKLLYEDNSGNLKAEASKLRKLTALNFAACLESGETNRFTCDLLKRDLEYYSKIVDEQKGVNNYKEEVMAARPNISSDNQKQWKSSITAEKVAEILTPLSCSETKPDPWEKLHCSKSKLTVEDVRAIRKARTSYSAQEIEICQIPQVEEKRKIPTFSLFRGKSDEKPKFSPSVSAPQKPSISKFQPRFGPSKNARVHSGFDSSSGDKDNLPPKPGVFKTAGDELRLQNLKKFGKSGGENLSCGSYGKPKKSLGGRGCVTQPFQPPFHRNEGEQAVKKEETNEFEGDERLKNIDPKMIEMIQNEIMDTGSKITWDDIAGLEFAKTTIQEVVVWPMLRPDIFTGLRRPPRGILLFGPPGTGKTLIGKCIASQSGATFLSISASSLTSKWVGEGEKMVRALFAVSRVYQPSVVFIDEIDSLLSQRSDTEHESSRRLKTEFLVQLDGVGTGDDDRILIVGATNRPQELDEAARRRLVKRLYIPLPETKAREQLVRSLMLKERHTLTDSDLRQIAELTEGYSGADMKHLCQEASLGPIRSIPPMQIRDIDTSQVRPVNLQDFTAALTRVKSTVSPHDLHNYLAWDKQFGCGTI